MKIRILFIISLIYSGSNILWSGRVMAQNYAIPSELNPIVQLVEENRYFLAQEKLDDLDKSLHQNFYYQFYRGITALFLNIDRPASLEHFKKAIQIAGESKKFPPSNLLTAKFFLAKTYFLLNQIDSAYFLLNRLYAITPAYKSDLRAEIKELVNYCMVAKSQMNKPSRVLVSPVAGLNSEFNDHSPLFTGNEQIFVFTSTRGGSTGGRISENGEFFEDIYLSTKRENSYRKPVRISQDINTDMHDAAVWISLDGREIFIYNDVAGNGDIYSSELMADGNWKKPEPLVYINSDARESAAYKSADGKYIFFASDRKGGYGGLDIYLIEKLPDGSWTEPQNLGTSVNTALDEETPFFHPNQKLYFSSKGHNNMGGYDIFVSDRLGKNTWSIPVSLGYPVNSPDDDLCFWPSTDGLRAFFASGRFGGKGRRDIYFAEFHESFRTDYTLVSGIAKVESGYLHFLRIALTNFQQTNEYRANASNGQFIFPVKNQEDYNAVFMASGNQSQKISFKVPAFSSKNGLYIYSLDTVFLHSPLILVDTIFEKTQVLKTVYFENMDFFEEEDFESGLLSVEPIMNLDFDIEFSEFNSRLIRQTFEPEFAMNNKQKLPGFYVAPDVMFPSNSVEFYHPEQLSNLISYLKTHPTTIISITGFTDGAGNEDFNKELAQKRAESVRKYLLENGVKSTQVKIQIEEFGQQLCNENQAAGELLTKAQSKNRRVEFRFLQSGSEDFLIFEPLEIDSALLSIYNLPHQLFTDSIVLPEFLYAVELISAVGEIQLPDKLGPFQVELKKSLAGVYSYFIGYFENKDDALFWLREMRKRGFSTARIVLEPTQNIKLNYYYSINLLTSETQLDMKIFSSLERVIEKKENNYFVYYYGQFISLSEAEKARIKLFEAGYKDAMIIVNYFENAEQ